MNILNTSIHKIDHFNSKVELLEEIEGKDITEYITKLFDDISRDKSKRKFVFRSDTTEVRSQLKEMLNGHFNKAANIIANRLLPIEINAQKEIEHLNVEIQRGSFIQIVVEDHEFIKVILSKADHSEFLDETDKYRLHSGLPKKKKVYKAILINFKKDFSIEQLYVYDTNASISKYWWDSFLELNEVYTDEENTRKSFTAMDSAIFSKIKKNYPADHTYLRNAAITYYRNRNEFDLEDFLSTTFREYKPHDPNFPVDELIRKVEELPEKKGFDLRFGIKVEEISARIINKIMLQPGMELHLKDVDNIERVVQAGLEDDQRKFIKIYSDSGYEHFK